ncbi:MAG: hypothetical protein ACT6Q8_04310 [Niveispirillum sp.]|uniref:hypothetical protein n=1 Tax=Niveispirillum sp. TaxID=1917217 RepID=UPI004035FF99
MNSTNKIAIITNALNAKRGIIGKIEDLIKLIMIESVFEYKEIIDELYELLKQLYDEEFELMIKILTLNEEKANNEIKNQKINWKEYNKKLDEINKKFKAKKAEHDNAIVIKL